MAKNTKFTKSQELGFISLLCGASAIAFAPIFVKLSEVGPTATAFWRLSLSFPIFFIWLNLSKEKKEYKSTFLNDFIKLSIPGFFFAGDLAVWHWSLKYTTVANATLLANFAPIFVTFTVWFFFKQRITIKFIMGMIIALFGASAIMGVSFRISFERLYGDMLGLITAIFYAGYIISIRELRAKFSTIKIMTWSVLSSSILLVPVILISGEKFWAVKISGWMVLIGLAIISQVCGQGLIAYALAHIPAEISSVTLLLQPFLAAIFAWIILGESMILFQILGGILVIIGIRIAQKGSSILQQQNSDRVYND